MAPAVGQWYSNFSCMLFIKSANNQARKKASRKNPYSAWILLLFRINWTCIYSLINDLYNNWPIYIWLESRFEMFVWRGRCFDLEESRHIQEKTKKWLINESVGVVSLRSRVMCIHYLAWDDTFSLLCTCALRQGKANWLNQLLTQN